MDTKKNRMICPSSVFYLTFLVKIELYNVKYLRMELVYNTCTTRVNLCFFWQEKTFYTSNNLHK
jgi:hypothetical protein